MMDPGDAIDAKVWESTGLFLMARVLGNNGTAITQASISSIRLTSFQMPGGEQAYTAPLTVSTVVFNTLQTSDPRWTDDTTGYNFAATVPAAAFPVGDVSYRVEAVLTPVSGDPIAVVADVQVGRLYSS